MDKVKYPRTFHLPFSPGWTSDDKVLKSTRHFTGKQVVVTKKMDGETSTLYSHSFHARSLDGRHHPSRDWLAGFHATFAHDIPEGWRICGENMYARHSIAYDALPSYFLAYSVWSADNRALAWDPTLEILELLGITPVEEVYRGQYDDKVIQALAEKLDLERDEGLVVRLADSFAYEDFGTSVAKWVRPGHVQTDEHWMHGTIVPNQLAR